MKKACILSIVLLLVASCTNGIREDSVDIPTKSPIKSTLDAKAKEKAEQEFSKYFTKCGDYYYSYFYEKVVPYKSFRSEPSTIKETWNKYSDVSSYINSKELIDADNRNKLEWQGRVSFGCKSQQSLTKDMGKEELSLWKGCSDSYGTNSLGGFPVITLSKNIGADWQVNSDRSDTKVGRTIAALSSSVRSEYRGGKGSCSEGEKKEILELDAKDMLCEKSIGGDATSCCVTCGGDIKCNEQGYEKLACSQIPAALLK